jgi:putative nucleotidyltransferase with HDIG domain
MKENEQNRQNWQAMQGLFIKKVLEIKPGPKFLPSGRLKTGEKLNYRDVVERASRSMIRFKKPELLIRMIVRIIAEQVKVTHTGVLLYSEKKDSYILIDSKGEEGKKIPIGYVRIPADNPLINIFMGRKRSLIDQHEALVYENLGRLLKDEDLSKKEKGVIDNVNKLKTEMELLGADVCIPAYFKRKLLGILILGHKLSGESFDDGEIGFFATLANDVAMAITNARLIENLQSNVKEIAELYEREHRLFIHTSIALAAAIDARDPYTHGHTERVTYYALKIADELQGVTEISNYKDFKEALRLSSLLHDIGKIGIPDNILNKNKELTKEEFEKVKMHSEIGATILRPIRELGDIIVIVRAHHEKYDGTGYPDGLKGNDIPLTSRVIAVADAFDTMTTERPYKKKKNIEDAIREIERNSGTQFDPAVVNAFLAAHQKNIF